MFFVRPIFTIRSISAQTLWFGVSLENLRWFGSLQSIMGVIQCRRYRSTYSNLSFFKDDRSVSSTLFLSEGHNLVVMNKSSRLIFPSSNISAKTSPMISSVSYIFAVSIRRYPFSTTAYLIPILASCRSLVALPEPRPI